MAKTESWIQGPSDRAADAAPGRRLRQLNRLSSRGGEKPTQLIEGENDDHVAAGRQRLMFHQHRVPSVRTWLLGYKRRGDGWCGLVLTLSTHHPRPVVLPPHPSGLAEHSLRARLLSEASAKGGGPACRSVWVDIGRCQFTRRGGGMAYAGDLKSLVETRAGSSPAPGTT